MSDCIYDMHAYARLGEYILKMIENSFDPVSNRDFDPVRQTNKQKYPIYLFVYVHLSIYMCIYLSIYLTIYISAPLSIYLRLYLSS